LPCWPKVGSSAPSAACVTWEFQAANNMMITEPIAKPWPNDRRIRRSADKKSVFKKPRLLPVLTITFESLAFIIGPFDQQSAQPFASCIQIMVTVLLVLLHWASHIDAHPGASRNFGTFCHYPTSHSAASSDASTVSHLAAP